ncbi:MAG: hypothetical protein MUC36_06430 [Planctomycetes bacterium]|nr:hypothetical protein [Planctomycetota bacterium]
MSRPRRARRRAWFVVVAVVLVWLIAEAAAAAALWYASGDVRWWRALAVDAEPGVGAAAQAAAQRGIVPHPYLGYVVDAGLGPVEGFAVSRYGFVDEAPPLRPAAPDRFVIGLVGGSVALQLGIHAGGALVQALERSSHLAGRRVELVRLCVGGWKQPQQLLAVQMLGALGGHFDCILNLDGFNEVALVGENVPLGVPAWYPRSWARLVESAPTADQLRRLGRLAWLDDQRQALANGAGGFGWLPSVQFVRHWRSRSLQHQVAALRAEIEAAPAAAGFAATGPGPSTPSVEQGRAEMAQIWARSSIALHELCRARGIPYFHFLQPNQYMPEGKPIGADEAKVALDAGSKWEQAVRQGYPLLQQQVPLLAAAGVQFTDLTGIYRAHAEPLYVDTCCHLGARGNELLAEHIAAVVRRRLDLHGVALQRLLPDPVWQLGPVASTPPVWAVDDRGRRHDVGGFGLGTTFTAEPADLVEIGLGGQLRALRRGRGQLQIRHAAWTATVALDASWPDRLVLADGRPDGAAPHLQVEPEAAGLRLTCTGLPPAPLRLVVVAPRPLPAAPPGADLAGLQLFPLAGSGPSAELVVGVQPVPGQPTFVRVYALGADAASLVAASNTVVVTGG